MSKKLDKIYNNSKKILIDDSSKIVIMSDCHRGAGNIFDNFLKNRYSYEAALNYYYKNGFTYIELGDGDDLWEVKDCKDIVNEYLNLFKQIKKFYDSDKLIMIYGNHDISKKYKVTLEECFSKYYDNNTKKEEVLLKGLNVYDSLILQYRNYNIFLLHGHQIDFLNGTLWRLSRFLVRYFWRTLEYIGIKDPTSVAKNHQIIKRIDKKLNKWSIKNNKILIAGHTHRPIFPKIGESLYFNDGSCIHPNGITCIEIEKGNISLVKWEKIVNKNSKVVIRKILGGKEPIKKYFK